MKNKTDVPQGMLVLMVLKTIEVLWPLHGYSIARRIEQISGDLLAANQGTFSVLLKLERESSIASEWGVSDNNHLQAEARDWEQTASMIGKLFTAKADDFP